MPTGRSPTSSWPRRRTPRSRTSYACSGCRAPDSPTASSAVRRGTWTSSTRSRASAGPTRRSRSTSTTPRAISTSPRPDRGRLTGAHRGADFAGAFDYLQSVAPEGMTPKLTIPSPSMVHYRGDGRDRPERLSRRGPVLGRPVRGVRPPGAADGRTRLPLPPARRHQPRLPQRPEQRANVAAQGRDAEHQHERYIRQINAAIKDRPEGLSVTTHMCRGNYRSSWAASGSYDFVAEALFMSSTSTPSSSSTTTSAPAASRPCASCPRTSTSFWESSAPSARASKKDEIKRRVDAAAKSVAWSNSASAHSAASPPPWRATTSPRARRSTSPPRRRDRPRGLGVIERRSI